MNKKTFGILLIVAGLVMAVLSLTADLIGLGADPATIGWKQFTGAGAGLIVLAIGLYFTTRAKKE